MEKEQIYLDLSKLNSNQIKDIPRILKEAGERIYGNESDVFDGGFYDIHHPHLQRWGATDIWGADYNSEKKEISFEQFKDIFPKKPKKTCELKIEKLEAEKAELLEALEETNRRIGIIKSEPDGIVRETMIDMLPIGIESLIKKHKQ